METNYLIHAAHVVEHSLTCIYTKADAINAVNYIMKDPSHVCHTANSTIQKGTVCLSRLMQIDMSRVGSYFQGNTSSVPAVAL